MGNATKNGPPDDALSPLPGRDSWAVSPSLCTSRRPLKHISEGSWARPSLHPFMPGFCPALQRSGWLIGKDNLATAKASTLTAGLGGCYLERNLSQLGWPGREGTAEKLSTPHGILAFSLPMCSEQHGKGRRNLLFSGVTTGLEADSWPKRPPPR